MDEALLADQFQRSDEDELKKKISEEKKDDRVIVKSSFTKGTISAIPMLSTGTGSKKISFAPFLIGSFRESPADPFEFGFFTARELSRVSVTRKEFNTTVKSYLFQPRLSEKLIHILSNFMELKQDTSPLLVSDSIDFLKNVKNILKPSSAISPIPESSTILHYYQGLYQKKRCEHLCQNTDTILQEFPLEKALIPFKSLLTHKNISHFVLIVWLQTKIMNASSACYSKILNQMMNLLLGMTGEKNRKLFFDILDNIIEETQQSMAYFKKPEQWNVYYVWQKNRFVRMSLKSCFDRPESYYQYETAISKECVGEHMSYGHDKYLVPGYYQEVKSIVTGTTSQLHYYYSNREKYNEFENALKIFINLQKLLVERYRFEMIESLGEKGCRCLVQ